MPSDVFIIGENITGLYMGIRSLEKGYITTIVDKRFKSSSMKMPVIFTDNHFAFKKFVIKYGFAYEEIENTLANDMMLIQLINKIDKLPSILQDSLNIYQFCQTSLGKSVTKHLFQHPILEPYTNSNIMVVAAMLKKNIINHKHYILKDNQSIVLEKLRYIFRNNGGIIIYRCCVFKINVMNNLSFTINTDKGVYKSNILIVTLKPSNILKLYPWSSDKIEIIDSIQPSMMYNPHIKTNSILERFNVAIPDDDNMNRYFSVYKEGVDPLSIYNNIKQILSSNVHLYICHTNYTKNQGWINGLIDMANDIIRSF